MGRDRNAWNANCDASTSPSFISIKVEVKVLTIP